MGLLSMKTNKLPLAVLSTPFLLGLNSTLALEYKVKKGDTFVKIAQRKARESHHLAYSQMLGLILSLNGHKKLSDFNLMEVGQVINLPGQLDEQAYLDRYQKKYPNYWTPWNWKVEGSHKYTIRVGDTLGKIAKGLFPHSSLYGKKGTLNLLLQKNNGIKDPNKIFVGQEIVLPRPQGHLYAHPEKSIEREKGFLKIDIPERIKKDRYGGQKRQPGSLKEKSSYPGEKRKYHGFPLKNTVDFEKNDTWLFHDLQRPSILKVPFRINFKIPSINSQCQGPYQSRYYDYLNRELFGPQERLVRLGHLKQLLNFSRYCRHEELEDYYLKLISLFLKPEREKDFLESLEKYFIKNLKPLEPLNKIV